MARKSKRQLSLAANARVARQGKKRRRENKRKLECGQAQEHEHDLEQHEQQQQHMQEEEPLPNPPVLPCVRPRSDSDANRLQTEGQPARKKLRGPFSVAKQTEPVKSPAAGRVP